MNDSNWEEERCAVTKALVGDEVTLCADVQDIPDGTSAKIKVVEKDADGQDDDVTTLTAAVSGGRIECAWKVVYMEDDDDADSEQEKAEKGYTLPEYAFTVECGGVMSEGSPQLDVMGWIRTQLKDKETGRILKNRRYILVKKNGEKIEGVSDARGFISEVDLEHGIYFLIVKD